MQYGVVSTEYIHRSSLDDRNGVWSFLRLTNLTPSDVSTITLGSLVDR